MRTTAMPPSPNGVAMAAMVSFWVTRSWALETWLGRSLIIDTAMTTTTEISMRNQGRR